MIHKRNTALERPVKNIFTGGLKPVSWRQPHTSSDVDQDTEMFDEYWSKRNPTVKPQCHASMVKVWIQPSMRKVPKH